MKDLLFNIAVTKESIYLLLLLIITGHSLYDLSFIDNKHIAFILITISVIVNLVLRGINVGNIIGSILVGSIAGTIIDIYNDIHQKNKGFKTI
jgi:hypothetical protein